MFKAFLELQSLGVIDRVPRLHAVQAAGCAPLVEALRTGAVRASPWADPRGVAPGLLVPSPFSSERILEAVRLSGGSGATVTDGEIESAWRALAVRYGLCTAVEGAAPFAALPHLLRTGAIKGGDRVLLYNTGSGWPRLVGPSAEATRAGDSPSSPLPVDSSLR